MNPRACIAVSLFALAWCGSQTAAAENADTLKWNPDDAGGGRLNLNGAPLLDVSSYLDHANDPLVAPQRVRWTDGVLELTGQLPQAGGGLGAQLRAEHHIDAPKHIWIPHLSPERSFVAGDHAMRSACVILADDRRAVVLIPDIDDIRAGYKSGWRTWMDYDHPRKRIVLAAGAYKVLGHVFYQVSKVRYQGQPIRLRFHVLASTRPEDLRNPYGLAARWIWTRWGRPKYEVGGSQRAPFDRYNRYIANWAFGETGWGQTVWQEFEIKGQPCGGPAFIVDAAQHPSILIEKRKWREQRSVWNQAWFSNQRCANGLLRYARQVGSKDLERRAKLSTALTLAAPQTDGLFPSVYTTARDGWHPYSLYKDTPGWEQGRWTNSDRRPGAVSEKACHVLDAAFTCRLLLEWRDIFGEDKDDGILQYVTRFADRLAALQRPSGAFPGWVEPDGGVASPLAEGPETAMGATLLLELLDALPNNSTEQARAYRAAAIKAVRYLEAGPVAEARWEDFETYYSCNRWGTEKQMGKRVKRNGVYKQNTFSPFWCAEAFLAAHRATGESRYLTLGRRCLDELSLWQQVWDPPFIPAPCHGGFGVMNADGEWNDARQSLFAPLYLAYYQATGHAEYFERGVSALRASFAMLYCPENEQVRKQYELRHPRFGPESYGFMMENIAHGGPVKPDGSGIGPFTIYTWGNGSALASAAKVRDEFGQVYVDPERKHAFGIDGCRAVVEEDLVKIEDRYGRKTLVVRYADGQETNVKLTDGRGSVPLRP